MEGVVYWGWRNVRLDLWSGLFLFGVLYKDGHGVPCPYGLCLSRCHIATFS